MLNQKRKFLFNLLGLKRCQILSHNIPPMLQLFTVLSLFLNWKFTFYSRYVLCDRCGKGLCSPRVQRYAVCILSMFQTYNFSSFYCFIPFHVPMIQHLILLMFPYFNVATFQHFLISVFHNPTISFFQ